MEEDDTNGEEEEEANDECWRWEVGEQGGFMAHTDVVVAGVDLLGLEEEEGVDDSRPAAGHTTHIRRNIIGAVRKHLEGEEATT